MKKIASLLVVFLSTLAIIAQEAEVKVVLDVTSSDLNVQKAALRHAKGMSASYTNTHVEVVVYGSAIDMVLKEKSPVASEIAELADNPQVDIVVCQGTMKRYNVTMAQIMDGVLSVPDAIMEIVDKQGKGWGYIKEAN